VSQPKGSTFGKAKRLLNAHDYSRVFNSTEAKAFHNNLLLLARRNGGTEHRLGLVIAKKNIRLAVQRNRVKRISREFVRKDPEGISMDIIVLARRGLDQLDNAEMASLFERQWNKLARQISKIDHKSPQSP
jgi:ribonuclease P protein component